MYNRQMIFPDYQFQMIPITVGALGYKNECLNLYLNGIVFNDKEIKMYLNKMQYLVSHC